MNPSGTFYKTTITNVNKSTEGIVTHDVMLISASTSDIEIITKTGIAALGAKTAYVVPEVASQPTVISEIKFQFESIQTICLKNKADLMIP